MAAFLGLSAETGTLLAILLTLFLLLYALHEGGFGLLLLLAVVWILNNLYPQAISPEERYGTWTHGIFKKIGIPGPRPLPFIGNFHAYRKGMLNFDMECFKKYGKTWGIYDGRQPVLAILDLVIIKAILVKECYTHFTNRRMIPVNKPLDAAVSLAKDEQWKRIRTVLSPTFTSGKLKQMFPIIKHYGEILVKNLQERAKQDAFFDMKQMFGAYSTDVVVSTSFGVNVDSMNNPNDPFVTNSQKWFSFKFMRPMMLLSVLFPFLTPVFKKLNIHLFPQDLVDFFANSVNSIKEKRQKGKHEERVDFLQLMVDSQTDGRSDADGAAHGYKALSDQEIVAQALTFILAGYETTSTSLSFTAYTVATHPDVQQKLKKEIDTLLPNKAAPTYDALMQMEYLEMVINETLRLYPPAGRLERMCKKTIEINGLTIPKGVLAMIPLYALHCDPDYWPEPDQFNPERFSKDNKDTQDPYTFLPFGSGPRNCIGMRFALLNMKVALVVLLQNFTFQTCKDTPIPMVLDTRGFIRSKSPTILKLVPRTDTALQV